MTRIQGIPQDQAGPMVEVIYWFMRRAMKKLTGREPARGGGLQRRDGLRAARPAGAGARLTAARHR